METYFSNLEDYKEREELLRRVIRRSKRLHLVRQIEARRREKEEIEEMLRDPTLYG